MPSDNTTQIILQLGKDSFPATFLSGSEEISKPFAFRAEFLAPDSFKVKNYPGTQVNLEFKASDGHCRRLSGLINFIEETGTRLQNVKQKVIHIDVVPRMQVLSHHTDHRIMLGCTVVDIVKETLERHGYKPEHLKFNLSQQLPVHPYTLQVEQTDLEFVQRVLARDGIFYYFDCETRDDITYEVIHFLDATSYSPYIKRSMIRYLPSSGMAQATSGETYTSLFTLQEHHALMSNEWSFHDYNEQTPEIKLLNSRNSGTDLKLKSINKNVQFGQGTLSLEYVDRQAKYAAERAILKSHHVSASGDVADVAAGRLTSLDANKLDNSFTGDYLITKVTHHLDHRAARDLTNPKTDQKKLSLAGEFTHVDPSPDYHCDILLVKREVSFRPDLPPRPEIPLTFTARIESEGRYATLDGQGRYHLRKLLDLGDRPHTQATIPPLRKLQPFAGPMQIFESNAEGEAAESQPTGAHFPLQDGDEVLLSCLNGDPDRPMIVGSHYDANRTNPVNQSNKNQNRWRTKSDNEILMDDKIDTQVIQMRTYEGFNILQFDAKKAEHKIRLATEHGAIHRYAKKTYHHKSDDTHEERSGNNRLEVVENKSFTKTKKGEIHYQTPTDLLQNAGNNILHQADENIEMTATENQLIIVEDENMEITVEGGGGFRIHVKNDELHIQAAKEIKIEGQGGGDITFHQSGGGFCVTKSGDIKLFGQDVQITGDQGVTLSGNVSYSVTSPPPGPSPSPTAELQPAAINELKDPDAPQIISLAWDLQSVAVGENAMPMFMVKNFQGGEAVTVKIFEFDDSDKKTLVSTLNTELDDGTGHYALNWKADYETTDIDISKEDNKEENKPLEFKFEVEIDGVREDKISPPLWLTRDVEFSLADIQGNVIEDETEVILYSSDDVVRYEYSEAGKVTFKAVPVGSIRYFQITGYQHKPGTKQAQQHKDVNSIIDKGIAFKNSQIGFVHTKLVSSKHKPLCGVECTLSAGGEEFSKQISNAKGEIYWAGVPLDNCELTITLGTKSVTQLVPWLATGEQAHEQFVINLKELTDNINDILSRQFRLAGLGIYKGRLDGINGEKTKLAQTEFIKKYGLCNIEEELFISLALTRLSNEFGA